MIRRENHPVLTWIIHHLVLLYVAAVVSIILPFLIYTHWS